MPDSVPLETLLAHRDWVHALARRLARDESAADDVVQQTWLAALRTPPRAESTAQAWLGRVVRNFAREDRRSAARRARREGVAARPEGVAGAGDVVAQADLHRRLVVAVMELEEPYRTTVLLRFFEGLPPRRVAARMAVPTETVRTRTRRALEQLRERLDREHGSRAWVVLLVPARRPHPAGSLIAVGASIMGKKALAVVIVVALLIGAGIAVGTVRPVARSDGAVSATHDAGVSPPRAVAAAPQEETPVLPVRPEAEGASLTGRVVDARGTPVRDAQVLAVPSEPPGDLKGPETTRTLADGSFRVPLSAGQSSGTPLWSVLADAPGHAPGASAQGPAGASFDVVLDVASSLSGRALDGDGRGIAGARVRWFGPVGPARLVRSATSGADGAFRLDGVPSRGQYGFALWVGANLAADAEGFAPLTVPVPADAFAAVELRLVRGATLLGSVLDGETSSPIAGVTVSFRSMQRSALRGDGLGDTTGAAPELMQTSTDAKGAFRFEHLPCIGFHGANNPPGGTKGPLAGSVFVIADGYAAGGDEVKLVKDGETTDALIRLWGSASAEGRVVDSAGRPLPHFRVTDFSRDRPRAWLPSGLAGVAPNSALTDAEGRYRLERIPVPRNQSAEVALYAHPLDAQLAMGFQIPPVTVSLRAGETVHAPDLVAGEKAPPAADIEVVDDAGRPVWGATVSRDQWQSQMRTGRDGRVRFWFTYNSPGAFPAGVFVRAPGFVTTLSELFTPGTTDVPAIRVQLARGRQVSGRVVTADGSPADGAEVVAFDASVPPDRAWVDGLPLGSLPAPVPADLPALVFFASSASRADGSFVLDGLPARPVHLRAAGRTGEAFLESVTPGAGDVVLTLPASREPERGDAEVEVVDARNGARLRGAKVLLWRSAGSDHKESYDSADAPGVVRFTGIVGGTWDVQASVPGFCTARSDLTIRRGTPGAARMELQPGAVVRGRVLAPPGVSLEGVGVWLQPLSDAPRFTAPRAVVAQDGKFEIPELRAGRWRLGIFQQSGRQTFLAPESVIDVVLGPGEESSVDLPVARAGVVSLLVGSAATSVSGWPASPGRFVVTDAKGRERMSGDVIGVGIEAPLYLTPGRYVLSLSLNGQEPVERVIDVSLDTPVRIAITLGRER